MPLTVEDFATRLVEKLRAAREPADRGELDADGAYEAAMATVAEAIEEVLAEARKEGRKEPS